MTIKFDLDDVPLAGLTISSMKEEVVSVGVDETSSDQAFTLVVASLSHTEASIHHSSNLLDFSYDSSSRSSSTFLICSSS